MKKKLLIMLAVVSMLVCIFAISVSAKTVTTIDGKEVTVTTYDDAPARTNITVSTDDVVVFDDGFCCPSAYVFKDNASIPNGKWGSPAFSNAFDFSYINGKTGKEYAFANVTEVDIPQGITSIGSYLAHKVETLKKVTIPDSVATFATSGFEDCKSIEVCVFEHNENSSLTDFPQYIFSGAASLKSFSMPDCITTMTGEGFHFANCSSLGAIYLSKNLETISGTRNDRPPFDYCRQMYFVNEPFAYDNVPSKPDVYYFPANLSNTPQNQSVFRCCENLNNVLVFDTGVTSLGNHYYFEKSPANTVVFLGDMTSVLLAHWGTTTVYFCNPNDVDASSAGLDHIEEGKKTWGGTAYYCNADGNTDHLYLKEANTAPTCTQPGVTGYECFCGKPSDNAVTVDPLGHEANELLNKYFASVNGTLDYYSDMITEHSCTRCDAIIEGTEKGTALFTKKGYSYSENDATTFSYTIYVNQDAIKSYNEALLYGIVVSANANGAPISYADGAISHDNKTIAIEFQSTDVAYSIITAKLTGVTATTELHLSAYCVDNGAVSYLGHSSVDKIAETISHEALLEKYPIGKEQ